MGGLTFTHLDSPVGVLLLVRNEQGLRAISFERGGEPAPPPAAATRDDRAFDDIASELGAYFQRRLTEFKVKLNPAGTPFQRSVWDVLRSIPYGETRSYSQVAAAIGRPEAVRAVGTANGANPLPIIVPCHRVIGTNGSLTGFGGGLTAKRFLLDLETYAETLPR
ncbi:MAG: methylated-DNA--[protein]-cysteine S-methyltransferase [Thermoanaerobaculia bacterium]|nr:methylated-DNA--[protein]-cysteine S-methyltransferase [Thermoanaerobaculia bacterium]